MRHDQEAVFGELQKRNENPAAQAIKKRVSPRPEGPAAGRFAGGLHARHDTRRVWRRCALRARECIVAPDFALPSWRNCMSLWSRRKFFLTSLAGTAAAGTANLLGASGPAPQPGMAGADSWFGQAAAGKGKRPVMISSA